jgi:hypothetical protein
MGGRFESEGVSEMKNDGNALKYILKALKF